MVTSKVLPVVLSALALLTTISAAKWPVTPIAGLRRRTQQDADELSTLSLCSIGSENREKRCSQEYPAYNFSCPIDHIHNSSMYEPHSNGTFANFYYMDDTYYKPGGPVLVLLGGETGAHTRIPFLTKGVINKLAKATNGLAVILEHRYYGKSWPTPDLSTDNLRFLTTEQALLDTVYFAEHAVFPGHEHEDLTASSVPWIVYGGSYAGAFAAFLRSLYPGVFWGAISSSGVTEAIYDYWQYWEPIREFGPSKCIKTVEALTAVNDRILTGNKGSLKLFKKTWGFETLTDNRDVANILTFSGIGGWQGRNWDPDVSSFAVEEFCGNLTSEFLEYPEVAGRAPDVAKLLASAGAKSSLPFGTNLTLATLNWIGHVENNFISPCLQGQKLFENSTEPTLDQCYTTLNTTFYEQDGIEQTWRAWPYQYCTQWGYLQTGSGTASNLPPLISRTIDLDYMSRICLGAFNITTPPDVSTINQWGGFNLSYPRLAHIAGKEDPWTPATPWKKELQQWKWRKNGTEEPFMLIDGAVHHWDENGLTLEEEKVKKVPGSVRVTQEFEIQFVSKWVEEARENGKFKGMMAREAGLGLVDDVQKVL